MSALLDTRALKAFYGDAQALFGIDFSLARGELVAIIGANGAGKSTFLKSLTGLVRAPRDAIRFKGEPIGGLPPGDIVRRGLAMVPEGRRLFPSLSVEENLLMGSTAARKGPWNLQRLYALFPILAEKRHQPGTSTLTCLSPALSPTSGSRRASVAASNTSIRVAKSSGLVARNSIMPLIMMTWPLAGCQSGSVRQSNSASKFAPYHVGKCRAAPSCFKA